MKKIISSVVLFGATAGAVFAQTTTVATSSATSTATTPIAVVSAGLTPESSFYFLDKITESLQELFTFNPDAKVKLQLALAAERVAEAKAMLATAGDHKAGLDVIHSSLVDNVKKTSEIIKTEKLAGKDVTDLAKEANNVFDSEEKDLNNSLAEAHKEIVDKKIEGFKKALEEAKAAKDDAKASSTEQGLHEMQQIAQDLQDKKDEIKKDFQTGKREIEDEMSEEDQAQDEKDHEIDNKKNALDREIDNKKKAEDARREMKKGNHENGGDSEMRATGTVRGGEREIEND